MVRTSRFADFEAQMGLLRDRLLRAVQDVGSGQVDEGLALYRRLLREALVNFREFEAGALVDSGADAARYDVYGDEWRILMRDLYDLAEVVAATSSTRIWTDYCSFVMDCAIDAADAEEPGAAAQYWESAGIAWRRTLLPALRRQRDQESLLIRLRDFVLIASTGDRPPQVRRELQMRTAAIFVQWLKSTIDAGDEDSGILCLRYFDFAFLSPRPSTDDSLTVFVIGCVVELYAWLLMKASDEDQLALGVLRSALRVAMSKGNAWQSLRALQAEELEPYIHSHFWELAGPGPIQSGVLQLGHFELLAALEGRLLPPSPEVADERDTELARRLLEVLDRGSEETDGEESAAEPRGGASRNALRRIVERDQTMRQQKLIAAPLDAARVGAFVSALTSELATSRRDRLLMLIHRVDWLATATGAGVRTLGWDGLVPKSFFVPQPAVFADPTDIANSVGGAIRTGEDDEVLALLMGTGPTEALELADVPATVANHLRKFVTPERAALVTNTYQAVQALVPLQSFGHGEELRTSDGSLVYRCYDDRPPFLLIFDIEDSLRVQRVPVDPAVPGDRYDSDLGLLIGVAPLQEDELERLVATVEPEARAERRRELLAATRVRVLERFDLQVNDDQLVRSWSLPQGSW